MTAWTDRGFTAHEHLDEHGIVHMNGRIYDPHLGRFLQADPLIEDLATLNRYTYVHNNPLVYYDPSGYLSFKDVLKIAAVVAITWFTAGILSGASWAAFTVKAGSAAAYAVSAAAGALSGYIMTGTLEGALWGAFSGAVFYGIGQNLPGTAGADGVLGTSYSSGELIRASAAHGLAGGTISELQGGKFGHGFWSAGISKIASPAIQSANANTFAQGTMAAVVGGSVSRMTGGKFANGAVTAAFAYAYSQAAQQNRDPGRPLTDEERSVARDAYGDKIKDYDSVRVYDRKFIPFQGEHVAMAPNGNIYWPAASGCSDLTSCTITTADGTQYSTRAIFVHEMGHVIQHQQGIDVMLRALPHQVWSGITFGAYDPYMDHSEFLQTPSPSGLNVEAQADWYMHSYCTRTRSCIYGASLLPADIGVYIACSLRK